MTSLHASRHPPRSSSGIHDSHADRLFSLRQSSFVNHAPTSTYQRSSHYNDDFLNRFDQIATLGGEDSRGNSIGHTGCVNALAWSQSGGHLATGSDDRKIILWKLGGSSDHPQSVESGPSHRNTRSFPALELAQSDVIDTGHRANIFNVKWAPNCSDRRLFTCAGDNQVRVFDLSRASACNDHRLNTGKEYRSWPERQGACTRILRCHTSRAKKISTENSPDIFLTVAEDGEVRQTDLRVPHTCSRSREYGQGCPRPLVQFKMELYSMSVSQLEPWLFAVAGTSDTVYLQDRRMIPRLLKNEWGSYVDEETTSLTHCVRRFTREPKPEAEAPASSQGKKQTRVRFDRAHITAVKISEANGRDLLASYSGDGVYRFDIKGETGRQNQATNLLSSNISKRRKTESRSVSPPNSSRQPAGSDGNTLLRRRVFKIIFESTGDADPLRISREYDSLKEDLDTLQALASDVVASSRAWRETEGFIVELLRALAHIKRSILLETEGDDMLLEVFCEALQGKAKSESSLALVSLTKQLQSANKRKQYSEQVKLRMLLFDQAEAHVKGWWERTYVFLPQTCVLPDRIQPSSESAPSEVYQAVSKAQYSSFQDRFRAMNDETDVEPLESGEAGGNAEIEVIDEEVADDSDDNSNDNNDYGEEDEDNDDDVDINIEAYESDEEEDEDEDEDDDDDDDIRRRHGISGEDAPLVYPNACFQGHANNETVKDCGYLGSHDEYVWSGSDCGHLFIWDNDRMGKLRGIYRGDSSVVNVVSQHPLLPICAVSGIDETVKIFGPVSRDSAKIADAFSRREEIMQRNRQSSGRNGFSSQRLLRLFLQHMPPSNGVGNDDDEEGQDCTVM